MFNRKIKMLIEYIDAVVELVGSLLLVRVADIVFKIMEVINRNGDNNITS